MENSAAGVFLAAFKTGCRLAADVLLAAVQSRCSPQISGTAWQPSPTLLRVVIARAQAKSGSINVTTVHSITGVGGGDDALASVQRGVFSVHTAAIVRLSAGDELLAQVVCVEKPDCIVHINGTASHLTLERLD